MATGTVKWFNNTKGIGFITLHNSGEDIYAHYSQIKIPGVSVLKEGQLVSFNIIMGTKGIEAVDITETPNQ